MPNHSLKEGDSILKLVSPEDRRIILDQAAQKFFKKGEQIVRVKDTDTNFYLINKGKVRVTLFSNEGKEVSFVDIEKGGNFGEFSAIDGKPRSANVIALTDSEITILSPEQLFSLLEKYPQVCIELLKQVTGVVRRLCDRIFEYSTLDARNRISLELIRLSQNNIDYDGIARISNPPTQHEMASRLSCTREAVSRELNNLQKQGIISRTPRRLVINDFKKLQEIADGKSFK